MYPPPGRAYNVPIHLQMQNYNSMAFPEANFNFQMESAYGLYPYSSGNNQGTFLCYFFLKNKGYFGAVYFPPVNEMPNFSPEYSNTSPGYVRDIELKAPTREFVPRGIRPTQDASLKSSAPTFIPQVYLLLL